MSRYRNQRPKLTPKQERNLLTLIIVISAITFSTQLFNRLTTAYLYSNTETASKAAIAQINTLRAQYNIPPITFDPRLFALATARVKDMEKYHYYDHVNPTTGECADTMKAQYGLSADEYVAENALDYGEASLVASYIRPITDSIEPWFHSRGHRYNLLYAGHISGAVACHLDKCVFLGLNRDRFGEGCTTAAEGQAYWNSTPLKPEEIQP